MKKEVKTLAEELFEDVQKVRESGVEEKDRVGIEIMALNALCNADKTLNEKG